MKESAIIDISKEYFEKNKRDALIEWQCQIGDDTDETAYRFDKPVRYDDIEYSDGRINFAMMLELGEIAAYGSIPVTQSIIETILEEQIKKYNKVKTLMEAVK